MFRDPASLSADLDALEDIERGTLRLVCQALVDFQHEAVDIFRSETDLEADIGEDITREALDSMGVSRIQGRLFGKMDYKRARYLFHPNYAVRQALFVDSKAEKTSSSARIQVSQISMRVRQIRQGTALDVPGKLPTVITVAGNPLLTTTIFVKYFYGTGGENEEQEAQGEQEEDQAKELRLIRVACIPNGMLQDRYNPTAEDTIWRVGPDAPSLDEAFRTRLSFQLLRQKAAWRVQDIQIEPEAPFVWNE